MKLLILSALCFVNICFAVELRRDDQWPPQIIVDFLLPIREICMGKTGVTAEAIQEFSDGDFHDDPKLKCYMNCVFTESNLVDNNGDLHFEKVDPHINNLDEEVRDIAKNFLANCRNIEGSDPCERAFSVHKCWKLHDPKHYFLV